MPREAGSRGSCSHVSARVSSRARERGICTSEVRDLPALVAFPSKMMRVNPAGGTIDLPAIAASPPSEPGTRSHNPHPIQP